MSEFKEKMKSQFEMSDLGLLHYFLGLEVNQTSDGIFISQEKFANDLLKKFGMFACKEVDTPLNSCEKLKLGDGTGPTDARLYRKLIGGLMYLTHTHQDIMFAVSFGVKVYA